VLSPKILFFKFSILNIIYELIRIVYINSVSIYDKIKCVSECSPKILY
jgi:hypothetical protein